MFNALTGQGNVLVHRLRPGATPLVSDGRDNGSSRAKKWIKDPVSFVGHLQDEAFDQLHGELTGMVCLLHMVTLDVGDYPQVAGVLAKRVA